MTIHVKFRCNHVYSFQEIAFIHFPIGFNVKKKKKKNCGCSDLVSSIGTENSKLVQNHLMNIPTI